MSKLACISNESAQESSVCQGYAVSVLDPAESGWNMYCTCQITADGCFESTSAGEQSSPSAAWPL
jgi:hypothetical protein